MNPRPTPSPFSPITIGPLTLKNRFIKSATNEGMSAQSVPSKQLVKLHSALAAGGIALTTVAYCAVSSDGRTLPNQLTLTQSSLPHFKALTDGVHQAGGLASAQITHGGCFTFIRERSTKRPLSASGGFNKIGLMSGMFLKQAMNESDMQQIARMLEEEGAHLLVLSAGMNAESITTMFGSSFPKENRVQQKNKIIALAMAIQRRKEPTVEFRE
eukprot:gene20511-20427_t